jgi:signal transduction histidine kinase/ActR/RegA family two-component response regulator
MSVNYSRLRTPSIGNHLLLLALGALLPVLLFAAGLAVVQAREERQTFERGMHDRVIGITSAIDAEVRATVAVLRTLAESQVLAEGDLQRFHGQALRVKNLHRDWVTVILAGANGEQIVNASRPYGSRLLPIDETASFEAVLRTQEPAIGSLSAGPRGLRQAFPVRVPVLLEGQLAYVLTAVVDPLAISRILSEQGMPGDWVVSVVDTRLLQVARQYQGQVQVGVTVAPAFHAALTSGATEGAYRGATLEDTPSYVTWRRSAFSGWSVGIGVPASSVEANAWRVLVTSLLGVGISLALALLLARQLARRISEPVALLAAQARALRRGDYSSSLQHLQPEGPRLLPCDQPPAPTDAALPGDNAPESAGLPLRELRELRYALDDAAQAMHALALARSHAESANRAKDEFLAMLGHELRNPLSAITTALQVLRMRPEGAPAAFAQGVLQRQTAHLTRLVDDLLDASRVSRGKIELERRPLDFAGLVQRVAVQVVGASPKHRLDLRLDAAWVSGDDTRLEQIVTNLLSNAVRYSPDGGVIELVLACAGDSVRLTVRDEGVGIAAELLPRMFDLFVQGDRAAARSQGGLGIGLTLAHRLAELHGGRLEAHSQGDGQGSTFILTLPGVLPVPDSAPATLSAGADEVRRLDVLLVDDHDDGRRMLREVLEDAGHRVTEAVDGPQALEQASAGTFDVALIDIGLPGIDGLEVARRLRRMGPPLTTTLLVAITGYGSPQDHDRSREAGFDLHVVKPLDGDDLLDQVQRLLLKAR